MPLTRKPAGRELEARIRRAVQETEGMEGFAHVATEQDVAALTALLSDPEVSSPIYTLPSVVNRETIAAFINEHLEERERGEGLLLVRTDESGAVNAYHDIQFWPEWAACELGGAIRRDRQNKGQGGAGAAAAFDWLFDDVGVELICETAALDNKRTARLLERIGFSYMGEIESHLPGGGSRASRYWELSKASRRTNSKP